MKQMKSFEEQDKSWREGVDGSRHPREFLVHPDPETGEIKRVFELLDGYAMPCGMGGPYFRVVQVEYWKR